MQSLQSQVSHEGENVKKQFDSYKSSQLTLIFLITFIENLQIFLSCKKVTFKPFSVITKECKLLKTVTQRF